MSSPVVTVTPDTPFQVALKTMHEHKFRRLPVVDKHGRLAGIVSERDLLHASPSPASSLSVWEMNYLLAKLTVQQVMTRAIIITSPETPIEHAASLMVANKIGGLPVVDENDHVVGVITETDIFKAFVEMIDGKDGIRLTLDLAEDEILPLDFIEAVYKKGGNLAALGAVPHGDGMRRVVLVIRGVSMKLLEGPLSLLKDAVVDVYELAEPLLVPPSVVRQNGANLKVPAR
jgi:acetoin utilization protein AcuB